MITLEPFKIEDCERLISWIKNEEDLIQFAGAIFSYPLTREQLYDYINSQKRQPLKIKLTDSGDIIGHCELNYSNKVPRLSRILIGKEELRNKGLGKEVVNQMISLIFKSSEVNLIELIVFDWNLNAINCYKKAGFYINNDWEDIVIIKDKRWRALSMLLERKSWKQ
jgi:RimJ/RimL family protein N-acetyltransferase